MVLAHRLLNEEDRDEQKKSWWRRPPAFCIFASSTSQLQGIMETL
jgi:hypothetical protein